MHPPAHVPKTQIKSASSVVDKQGFYNIQQSLFFVTEMAVLEEEVSSMRENSEIEWSVENEVQLLLALIGHKPVGVSKYFHMACILDKFSVAIHRDDISSKTIWDRLDTMYDMQALEETELVPFPNEQEDFSLPKSQYGALVEQKLSSSLPSDDSDEDLESASKTAKGRKDSIKKEEPKKTVEDAKRKSAQDKKELRATKRGAKDDDDQQSVSTPSAAKKSRESSDVEDTPVVAQATKRTSSGAAVTTSSNNKAKRPTRLSQGKNDDIASPPVKRRRN